MPVKKRRVRIYRPTARNLAFLARRLCAGDIVGVPTETVYGLAGNALDEDACRAIFRAKGRPASDPLIVHIHSIRQLLEICVPNAATLRLAKRFWPGPLTLVLPKTPVIPDIVTAGKDSVAVRMPAHAVFRRLLKLAGIPLAAPSANPFGYISPTTAIHVADSLGTRIAHVLDGGPASIGLESTIVDLRDPSRPRVLRPGLISTDSLSHVLRRPVPTVRRKAARATEAQLAPGLLARHYSPRTPVVLHERIADSSPPGEAFVFLRQPAGRPAPNVYWLDRRGDLRGVARRLFAVLRAIDAQHYRRIHVERPKGGSLAEAINDRLRRAAAR